MYPSEFDTPASYAPVEGDLFFSLPPTLLLLITFFILVALAIVLWLSGAWSERHRRRDDPCDAIYEAVRKAVEEALKAPRDQVHARANQLLDTLNARLGGVMTLAGGLAGPCGDIHDVMDPRPDKHDPHHGAAHDCAKGARASELVVVNTGKLVVHAGGGGESGKGCETGHGDKPDFGAPSKGTHGPHAPDRRAEIERLRAAIHAFADHWRDKEARISELRRARANLY